MMQALIVSTLAEAANLSTEAAIRWFPHVAEVAEYAELDTPERLAMWIAQTGHESANFSRLVENLNYSADGLMKTWPSRFPTKKIAEPYHRKPKEIANRVYANRLGNGDEASGEGWLYRGRGLIQVTGKANYRACGNAINYNLVERPDKLAEDRYAALSSAWYWRSRNLNAAADDVPRATKLINGGTHGLADRDARYTRALKVLVAREVEAEHPTGPRGPVRTVPKLERKSPFATGKIDKL